MNILHIEELTTLMEKVRHHWQPYWTSTCPDLVKQRKTRLQDQQCEVFQEQRQPQNI